MANVTLAPHETLNNMLKRPQIDAFINEDWEFEQNMRMVKKIGNYAAHTGAQQVKANDAFICLRALFYVATGFLYRWQAIRKMLAFDATLIPQDLPRFMHQTIPSQPYLPTSQTMFLPRPSITRNLKISAFGIA